MDALGRLNEDTNNKLHATEDELENYKKDLEQAKAEIDRQNEELKRNVSCLRIWAAYRKL